MEKEKFTKEEIETAKKVFETYKINPGSSNSYNEFLSSLFKPERKKIFIQVEFDDLEYDLGNIEAIMNEGYDGHWVFKELPEVFSREEIIKMFTTHFSSDGYIEILINYYLERKSNE